MIAAIVLAAGASSRFGEQKLLLPLEGEPIIRRTVENVLASQVQQVVVVLGREADAVRDALAGLAVRCIVNPSYRDGMSTSLRAGVMALPPGTRATLVVLGDQPDITPAILDRLITMHHELGKPIAVPVYVEGTRGNPVLFDASVFPELLAVSGDQGSREVIARAPDRVAAVTFPFPMPRDVDSRADYEALLGRRPYSE